MIPCGILVLLSIAIVQTVEAQCGGRQSLTFVRWSGFSPERGAPVFVYSASGDEESLTGACLARCRELEDCGAVAVEYGKGNCHGIADSLQTQLRTDNDVTYFKKLCLDLPKHCDVRWWTVESTPGYNLNSDSPGLRIIFNSTIEECYQATVSPDNRKLSRSAQWVAAEGMFNSELITTSEKMTGNCILNAEDKFSEPESYRVSNYYTVYIENQCRHDYPKKIDRCSYEEYYNQTLRHVEITIKNYTKTECKTSCETEDRFICRGFTWTLEGQTPGARGLCDLHSEDLVTAGSWLLRRTSAATYYRRVICLNITVECEGSNLIVQYRPRGSFRGRVYVPGRGEQCSARATSGIVRLALPLYGDCDVNFAHGISNSPTGIVNRTMAYVMVMVQNNPIIQTAGDRWVRVGCSPGTRTVTQVDASVAVRDTGKPIPSDAANSAPPAGASAVFSANTAPLTMYVVRAASDGAGSGGGSVSLGEPLELRIETTEPNEIEAYHLVASSRLGDSSVLLLDSKGCSTGQVDFPSFKRSWLEGTQRLAARFKAFRFPTSHVVRFQLMVRFCEIKCVPVDCGTSQQLRAAREANDTSYKPDAGIPASIRQDKDWDDEKINEIKSDNGWDSLKNVEGVIAQGGAAGCGGVEGRVPLELEMVVNSKDMMSADTLVRADHRANARDDTPEADGGTMVCVHELLLVALALAWLAVQVLLLLGCCVLVKRYRNLAEMSMQKDYQPFDNVGFDTVSTHRRVHWPDQNIDILHTN